MPNLQVPITTSQQGINYKKMILSISKSNNFLPLVPCYLTENLNLLDFETALKENIFVGAKLYPTNATTNSSFGITKIENIFPMLEILEKLNKPLLIHGEKVREVNKLINVSALSQEYLRNGACLSFTFNCMI